MTKKPAKALVRKERTVHVYAELWHASRCVLEAGIRDPRGSAWQFLSSAILTAFALEAYLNHVGMGGVRSGVITQVDWDHIEQLAPLEKHEELCARFHAPRAADKGIRPLQTVVQLLQFRNSLAHGRSETLKPRDIQRDVNSKLDDFLGQRPLTDWEQLIKTSDFATRARQDVEAVLTPLHASRPDPKEARFAFGLEIHSAIALAESR
jgi:predicted TIM-barrel fold metal-dependent hydrolase